MSFPPELPLTNEIVFQFNFWRKQRSIKFLYDYRTDGQNYHLIFECFIKAWRQAIFPFATRNIHKNSSRLEIVENWLPKPAFTKSKP